jgi:putative FmdB family regulatory protein
MPIYEYRCSSCGREHEALQKLSDPLLVTCPHCHKDALVKQVSAAGFQLKGSGWYVTDFRNGSKPATAVPPKTDAAGTGDAKSPATADAPAKAAETKSDAPASAPAPATPKPSSSSTD